MRIRQRLEWSPTWEGQTEGWARSFLWKNLWRCDPIHSFEDLLQDAYLTFLKIVNRYPRVMGQAHFMTLYRAAMSNEMHDRARYVRRKREIHQETSVDASDLYTGRIGDVTNHGYLALVIGSAPEELQQALACISENPPALHRKNGHRENLNAKLNRVLGHETPIDLVGGIRKLLEV